MSKTVKKIILRGLDLRMGDVIKVETNSLIARYEVISVNDVYGESLLEPFEYKS